MPENGSLEACCNGFNNKRNEHVLRVCLEEHLDGNGHPQCSFGNVRLAA